MATIPARTCDDLRLDLAQAGVGLFHPATTVGRPTPRRLADLIRSLLLSGDARLEASIPCVLVLHADRAAPASALAAEGLPGAARDRLGLLHRLARALAVSRSPDLQHLLGRVVAPAPLAFEPAELPGPDDDFGERCLSVARETHEDDPGGNVVGDVTDLFDAWIRQAEIDRLSAADA